MLEKLDKCNICPHQCKVNRNQGKIGRCKATEKIKIALTNKDTRTPGPFATSHRFISA